MVLKGLAMPSFHVFCLSPPFFLPHTDWAGFHQGFQVDYFTLLLGSKFYLQVSKGHDMKSTEEKGSKIIVNFGNAGGRSFTNQLTNVF